MVRRKLLSLSPVAKQCLTLGLLQVLDSKNRPCLTERALLSNLTAIVADAARTPPNQVAQSALGVLSTERRATWAEQRIHLSKNMGNAMCLEVLDKALFVVCLDDSNPESASELCSNMLCELSSRCVPSLSDVLMLRGLTRRNLQTRQRCSSRNLYESLLR